MQTTDQKLAWAIVFVFAVLVLELGWVIITGPGHGNPVCGVNGMPPCDAPWWDSAALWTAAFTCALTVSTYLLWRETRRLAIGADDQAEKMRLSIREQRRMVFASLVSAKAAKKFADISEKNIARSERPYVFIQPGDNGIEIDKDGDIVFHVANHGKTPAVIELVSTCFLEQDTAPTPPYPKHDDRRHFVVYIPLGVGERSREFSRNVAKSNLTYTHPKGHEDRKIAVSKGNTLFFVISVEYRDAFGNKHRTSNCWMYYEPRDGFMRLPDKQVTEMT